MFVTTKRLKVLLLAVLFMSLFLAACGGGGDEEPNEAEEPTAEVAQADPTDEPEPTPEPEPTDTPEPEPTDTPEPEPTDTPEPTPEPTADPAAGFVEFTSEAGGFSIMHPDGWLVEDLFGLTVLVSSEALLEADEIGSGDAGVFIFSGSKEELGITETDLVAALEQGQESMDLANAVIIEEPNLITLNGQDAARMIVETTEDGVSFTAVLYFTIVDDRAAIVMGMSPVDEVEQNVDLFQAIANTLELMEPTGDVSSDLFTGSGDADLGSAGILFFGDTVAGSVVDDAGSSWEFIGLEGEVVDITVVPSSDDFDVVVDVVDLDGNSILPDGEVDEAFGTEAILGLEIPTTSTFYVVVRGFAGDTGDYELTFNEAGETSGSTDGSTTPAVTGGDLGYDETLSGAITAESATSAYSFAGNAGDIAFVTVDPAGDLNVAVDIVNADTGESLLFGGSNNYSGSETVMAEIPAAGLYNIVVEDVDGVGSGEFDITLTGPDGSLIFADDTLEEAGEEHAFPFNAPAGATAGIVVMPQDGLDVVVKLFNEDTDEELFSLDRSFNTEAVAFTADEGGNYYFLVTGFQAEGDDDDGGEAVGDYEVMIFGTDLVATEAATGDTIRGVFSQDDGIIEFTLGLEPGDVIQLTLEVADDLDGVIEILDLDSEVIAEADNELSGDTETLLYEATEEGLVIIRVSEFFGDSGPFSLSIDRQ